MQYQTKHHQVRRPQYVAAEAFLLLAQKPVRDFALMAKSRLSAVKKEIFRDISVVL